jgi:hypothetical protein
MSSKTVVFPYLRLGSASFRRPLLWLLVENPHNQTLNGIRCPALIDTGADRSLAPYTFCRQLGHVFENGVASKNVSGIGQGSRRTFAHQARITVLATPTNDKAAGASNAVFPPLDLKIDFIEQKLPFLLLGQSDFQQLFHYQQIRAKWIFSLSDLP